jgi:ribose/xylose/arabinose/galactoside ABC-type transport system permease subunit
MNANTKKVKILSRRGDMSTVVIISIAFAVVVVLVQLISSWAAGKSEFPSFISPLNLLNILMQTAGVGILVMGMTAVMIGGGIDLSVGMMVSMVGIFVAKGIKDWGIDLVPAILLGIVIAVVAEDIMGFIISRLNVESFIITLGGMIAFKGIGLLMCRSQEVTLNQNLEFFKINLIEGAKSSDGLSLNLPIYVIIFFVVTLVFWIVLKYSKFGRRVYAVGSNPQAAYLSGINVKNIRLLTYVFNGVCVGIAGVLMLARVNVGTINLGQNLEIDAIAAVVIGGVAMSGGKGNALGSFIGVILLGAIANAMNLMRIQSEWQYFVKGLVLIIAVAGGALSARISAKRQIKRQAQ